MKNPTTVLIADDHDLVRQAIVAVINANADFDASSTKSLEETEDYLGGSSNVDIVMLDLVMPGMQGLPSIKKVVEMNELGKVVLFSGNVTPNLLDRAMDLGCAGLIPKSLPLKSLLSVLNLVASGQVFVPFTAKKTPEPTTPNAPSPLSERDVAILQGVASGMTNKEIAWNLLLAEVTIKAQLQKICLKLDAKNRANAVNNARSLGVI